jgi:membrane dipeptidase
MTCSLILTLLAALASGDDEFAARAHALQRTAVVVDTHSDVTMRLSEPKFDFGARNGDGHMDIPRMIEGGLNTQFFSIYMGKVEGPGTGPGTAIMRSLDLIDSIYQLCEKFPDRMAMAYSVADVRRLHDGGKIAALLGMEGGHMIEDDLSALRMFYRLGVRYMTLTHTFHTNWADSAGSLDGIEPKHNGLTEFGRQVVREMNRLGMMVDISHVADSTFFQVLEVSSAPVIASHSSCRALCEAPRNMTDDMIRALAKHGGVIQINFYPAFIDDQVRLATMARSKELKPQLDEIDRRFKDDEKQREAEREKLFKSAPPLPTTPWTRIVDHIEHVINLVGPDHVGMGADWDGVPSLPTGMEDCSHLELITAELLRRGQSEENVRKFLGENLLRVMAACEQKSAELRAKKP